MAQIVLKIITNEGGDVLTKFSTDNKVNNVSTLIGEPTTDNDGVNGKSFATGFLSLEDGFVGGQDTSLQSETEKYNGFMFKATDNDGNYLLDLFLLGNNLDKIVVTGDKNANQYPTVAVLDAGTQYEKTIYSDNLSWAISFDYASVFHSIRFTKWKRPNYNACFTTLKVMDVSFDLDKGWIDSIESLSQSISDPSSIQYGVLANSGSANIIDNNGTLANYVKTGIIANSNMTTKIIINDNNISKHISLDIKYDNNSKLLTLEETNDLSKLSSMNFNGLSLIESTTAYNLLKTVLDTINYNIEEIASDDVKSILQQITIEYPYLEADTYANTIKKFCDMAQLQMLEDNNGNVILVNGRPIANSSEISNAIKIPKNMMISSPNEAIIIKNKINKISYTNKTYDYSAKKIGSAAFTYYEQTPITQIYNNTDNTKTIMYSGMLKDYKYVGANQSKGESDTAAILGIYDFDTTEGFAAGKGVINKIRVDNNSISKLDWWFVHSSNIMGNYYPKYESTPSVQTTAFLQYKNENFSYPSSIIYDIPFTFVSTEEEALGNLLSADYTKIRAFGYQIIVDKNYITIYYPHTIEDAYTPSAQELYRGEIYSIDLSTTDDIYIKALSVIDNTIINETAKDYTLPTNELIVTNNTVGDKTIIDVLQENLLSDYKNGVSSATIDIFCGDMYNVVGSKIKNWKFGEIINVRDIVYFENDVDSNNNQRYWRVTGRKFIYDGSPKLSLELQEIVNIF